MDHPTRSALLFGAILLLSLAALSQSQADLASSDKRIFQEIRDHNQIMANLEYLSDTIGPRLTGSPALDSAADWAAALSRRYQLEDVHLEKWTIAHSWQRGAASARITSPITRPITIASVGWAPGTKGPVAGPVVYISPSNPAELQQFHGKLKGAFIILHPPSDLSWQLPMQIPQDRAPLIQPPESWEAAHHDPGAEFRAQRLAFLANEGALAVLQDSDKTWGLLNMSTLRPGYDPAPLPSAFLTHEDFLLIWRLMQKGPVNLEIAISNTFSEAPREVPNVVAEIPGAVHPDEVVIICAHLDSWDLGTGATDDGAGVVAVLEAARALQALHLRPNRTIRIVLFTGEEQGGLGSQAYVKAHAAELNKISAVLEDDTAASTIDTLRINQAYAALRDIDLTLAPMSELQLLSPHLDRGFGSDYANFNAAGIPAFAAISGQSAYFRVHHSQADTFDKIQLPGVLSAAEVLAGWAYNTAQLPEMLPRN